jgi:hypothetical protein
MDEDGDEVEDIFRLCTGVMDIVFTGEVNFKPIMVVYT